MTGSGWTGFGGRGRMSSMPLAMLEREDGELSDAGSERLSSRTCQFGKDIGN